VGQVAAITTAGLNFAHVTVAEPAPPQFGYVRADGSFIRLAATEAADF